MSDAMLFHMGAFAEQFRREVYPLLSLHPWLAENVHQRLIRMWEVIEDPDAVFLLRRQIRYLVARELRYMAENYETLPGRRKLDEHVRRAYRYRRQADRFEARP